MLRYTYYDPALISISTKALERLVRMTKAMLDGQLGNGKSELQSGIPDCSKITYEQFMCATNRMHYRESKSTSQQKVRGVLRATEEILNPRLLRDITAEQS